VNRRRVMGLTVRLPPARPSGFLPAPRCPRARTRYSSRKTPSGLRTGSVRITQGPEAGRNIRARRRRFREGKTGLARGRALLDAGAITLCRGDEPRRTARSIRKPRVAILATGDELRLPGQTLGPGQIIASNTFGIAALARGAGARGPRSWHRRRPDGRARRGAGFGTRAEATCW
jgi:hypothetical protein